MAFSKDDRKEVFDFFENILLSVDTPIFYDNLRGHVATKAPAVVQRYVHKKCKGEKLLDFFRTRERYFTVDRYDVSLRRRKEKKKPSSESVNTEENEFNDDCKFELFSDNEYSFSSSFTRSNSVVSSHKSTCDSYDGNQSRSSIENDEMIEYQKITLDYFTKLVDRNKTVKLDHIDFSILPKKVQRYLSRYMKKSIAIFFQSYPEVFNIDDNGYIILAAGFVENEILYQQDIQNVEFQETVDDNTQHSLSESFVKQSGENFLQCAEFFVGVLKKRNCPIRIDKLSGYLSSASEDVLAYLRCNYRPFKYFFYDAPMLFLVNKAGEICLTKDCCKLLKQANKIMRSRSKDFLSMPIQDVINSLFESAPPIRKFKMFEIDETNINLLDTEKLECINDEIYAINTLNHTDNVENESVLKNNNSESILNLEQFIDVSPVKLDDNKENALEVPKVFISSQSISTLTEIQDVVSSNSYGCIDKCVHDENVSYVKDTETSEHLLSNNVNVNKTIENTNGYYIECIHIVPLLCLEMFENQYILMLQNQCKAVKYFIKILENLPEKKCDINYLKGKLGQAEVDVLSFMKQLGKGDKIKDFLLNNDEFNLYQFFEVGLASNYRKVFEDKVKNQETVIENHTKHCLDSFYIYHYKICFDVYNCLLILCNFLKNKQNVKLVRLSGITSKFSASGLDFFKLLEGQDPSDKMKTFLQYFQIFVFTEEDHVGIRPNIDMSLFLSRLNKFLDVCNRSKQAKAPNLNHNLSDISRHSELPFDSKNFKICVIQCVENYLSHTSFLNYSNLPKTLGQNMLRTLTFNNLDTRDLLDMLIKSDLFQIKNGKIYKQNNTEMAECSKEVIDSENNVVNSLSEVLNSKTDEKSTKNNIETKSLENIPYQENISKKYVNPNSDIQSVDNNECIPVSVQSNIFNSEAKNLQTKVILDSPASECIILTAKSVADQSKICEQNEENIQKKENSVEMHECSDNFLKTDTENLRPKTLVSEINKTCFKGLSDTKELLINENQLSENSNIIVLKCDVPTTCNELNELQRSNESDPSEQNDSFLPISLSSPLDTSIKDCTLDFDLNEEKTSNIKINEDLVNSDINIGNNTSFESKILNKDESKALNKDTYDDEATVVNSNLPERKTNLTFGENCSNKKSEDHTDEELFSAHIKSSEICSPQINKFEDTLPKVHSVCSSSLLESENIDKSNNLLLVKNVNVDLDSSQEPDIDNIQSETYDLKNSFCTSTLDSNEETSKMFKSVNDIESSEIAPPLCDNHIEKFIDSFLSQMPDVHDNVVDSSDDSFTKSDISDNGKEALINSVDVKLEDGYEIPLETDFYACLTNRLLSEDNSEVKELYSSEESVNSIHYDVVQEGSVKLPLKSVSTLDENETNQLINIQNFNNPSILSEISMEENIVNNDNLENKDGIFIKSFDESVLSEDNSEKDSTNKSNEISRNQTQIFSSNLSHSELHSSDSTATLKENEDVMTSVENYEKSRKSNTKSPLITEDSKNETDYHNLYSTFTSETTNMEPDHTDIKSMHSDMYSGPCFGHEESSEYKDENDAHFDAFQNLNSSFLQPLSARVVIITMDSCIVETTIDDKKKFIFCLKSVFHCDNHTNCLKCFDMLNIDDQVSCYIPPTEDICKPGNMCFAFMLSKEPALINEECNVFNNFKKNGFNNKFHASSSNLEKNQHNTEDACKRKDTKQFIYHGSGEPSYETKLCQTILSGTVKSCSSVCEKECQVRLLIPSHNTQTTSKCNERESQTVLSGKVKFSPSVLEKECQVKFLAASKDIQTITYTSSVKNCQTVLSGKVKLCPVVVEKECQAKYSTFCKNTQTINECNDDDCQTDISGNIKSACDSTSLGCQTTLSGQVKKCVSLANKSCSTISLSSPVDQITQICAQSDPYFKATTNQMSQTFASLGSQSLCVGNDATEQATSPYTPEVAKIMCDMASQTISTGTIMIKKYFM